MEAKPVPGISPISPEVPTKDVSPDPIKQKFEAMAARMDLHKTGVLYLREVDLLLCELPDCQREAIAKFFVAYIKQTKRQTMPLTAFVNNIYKAYSLDKYDLKKILDPHPRTDSPSLPDKQELTPTQEPPPKVQSAAKLSFRPSKPGPKVHTISSTAVTSPTAKQKRTAADKPKLPPKSASRFKPQSSRNVVQKAAFTTDKRVVRPSRLGSASNLPKPVQKPSKFLSPAPILLGNPFGPRRNSARQAIQSSSDVLLHSTFAKCGVAEKPAAENIYDIPDNKALAYVLQNGYSFIQHQRKHYYTTRKSVQETPCHKPSHEFTVAAESSKVTAAASSKNLCVITENESGTKGPSAEPRLDVRLGKEAHQRYYYVSLRAAGKKKKDGE